MTLSRTLALGALALLLGSTAALADVADDIAARLRAEGWSDIEISRQGGRLIVEAERGDDDLTLVVDAASGRVVSEEIDDDADGEADEEDEEAENDEDKDEDDEEEEDDTEEDGDAEEGDDNGTDG
jgi:hypothetical protein